MKKNVTHYKIALLVDHFLPQVGGIELHVRDLALMLRRNGHEVHIMTPNPGEDRVGDVPIHRLKTSLLPGAKILWNFSAFRQLQKILHRERFDLMHIHASVMSPFAYGSVLFFRNSLPTVVTTHSLLNNTTRVFRGLHALSRWGDWPVSLSGVSQVVSQSLGQASCRKQVPVLPNGIDLSPWLAIRPALHPELRVTTVMRLHRKKRPEALIRSIPGILTKVDSPSPLRFTLIGDGPERFKLEDLSRRLGIEKHVEFLGYRPREEIQSIFAKTDLFVLPTIKEAFGIALLEARAAGLPIVAMNFGGTRDIVQNGIQGFLCDTDEEFAHRIVELLQDENLRKKMSESAREGLEKFGWNSIIDKHLVLYRTALERFADLRLKTGKTHESLSHDRYGARLSPFSQDLSRD